VNEPFFQDLLNEVHEQFTDQVKLGRGERLAHNEDIFTGLIWTGAKAQKLGLTDGIGNLYSVSRDQIGLKELLWYGPEKTPLKQLMDELGYGLKIAVVSVLGLENRSIQLY